MLNAVDEKLQCLIIDENKVVTYKTLSSCLNVHAGEAKTILSNFFNDNHNKYCLKAYYMIIGVQLDKNNAKTFKASMVSEADLETAKLSFSSTSSIHIYCVYKGNKVDKGNLYAVDYGLSEQCAFDSFSHINNSNIRIQTGKMIKYGPSSEANVKRDHCSVNDQAVNKNESKPPAVKNSNIFSCISKKEDSKKSDLSDETDSISPESATSNAKSGKNSAKMTVAQKAQNKTDVKYLFSKQAEKNSSISKVNRVEESVSIASDKTGDHQAAKPSKSQKSHQAKRNKGSASYRCEDSDSDTMKPKKKHRRIQTLDESDSESESEEIKDMARRNVFGEKTVIADCHEVKEEEEEEDDDKPIPPTPPAPNCKTMMKIVNTFSTDGEFLVTKKAKECVTVAEESDSNFRPPKPKASKEPVRKKVLLNKKQSSLTSFFKQR